MSSQPNNNVSVSSEQPKFQDPQEEIAYLRQKLDETQTEFLEFQESSRELETEYETQIQQLELKNSGLQNQILRLEDENEQIKARYNSYTNDTQHKLTEYQQQLSELTSINDRLSTYIRELEQSNDDLERARRALAASLEDFEVQLNQQIERNVLLENEVSEKEELECIVQRLREETRDLKHELIANKNSSNSARRKLIDGYVQAQTDSPLQSLKQDSPIMADTITKLEDLRLNGTESSGSISMEQSRPKVTIVDSTTSPGTPQATSRFSFSSTCPSSRSTDSKSQQTSSPPSPSLPAISMTSSTRISALNIVTDLLRKVGALESKLVPPKNVAT